MDLLDPPVVLGLIGLKPPLEVDLSIHHKYIVSTHFNSLIWRVAQPDAKPTSGKHLAHKACDEDHHTDCQNSSGDTPTPTLLIYSILGTLYGEKLNYNQFHFEFSHCQPYLSLHPIADENT